MMTRSVVRPYPGSRPFAEADFDHFFGRSKETETLSSLWLANRLTFAIGPTGIGKTSLLLAGVLPLVRCSRAEVLPPGRISYGAGYPVAALPEHNPFTLSLLRSWIPGERVTRLAGLTVRDFVRREAVRHEGPILAAIDQAEDLLAVDSGLRGMYWREFLEDLAGAVREEPRLHLLLMVRGSAVDEFSRILGNGVRHDVAPLDFKSALKAVTGPAEQAGRTFAPGAAEELVTDLLTSYAGGEGGGGRSEEPDSIQPALLQVVCTQLWESLPADTSVVTSRDVRAFADADPALTDYCGRIVTAVADGHYLKARRLHSWLIDTFVTERGTRGAAYEGVADTAGMPNAVVRDLEDRHLLSSERRDGLRWYKLLDERLIEPLRRATVDRPSSADPAGNLQAAERALTLGDLDLAARHGEEILLTSPPDAFGLRAEANSLLGNVAHECGKPAEAEGYYRQAAELFEAVQDAGAVAHECAAVGQTLLAQGRVSDAVNELVVAVHRLPNDNVLRAELAWAHWQCGEARAAEAIFSDILAEDAGNASALRGRGEILADIGKGREAMRDLNRTTPHDKPSTRAARGLALAELGDRDGAVKEIEGALAEAPRNGPVLLYAARAAELGGNRAVAAERAKQAIKATDPPLPLHQHDKALKLAGPGNDDAEVR
jgi:tetratricopeptide (TPR) repeat protein